MPGIDAPERKQPFGNASKDNVARSCSTRRGLTIQVEHGELPIFHGTRIPVRLSPFEALDYERFAQQQHAQITSFQGSPRSMHLQIAEVQRQLQEGL